MFFAIDNLHIDRHESRCAYLHQPVVLFNSVRWNGAVKHADQIAAVARVHDASRVRQSQRCLGDTGSRVQIVTSVVAAVLVFVALDNLRGAFDSVVEFVGNVVIEIYSSGRIQVEAGVDVNRVVIYGRVVFVHGLVVFLVKVALHAIVDEDAQMHVARVML